LAEAVKVDREEILAAADVVEAASEVVEAVASEAARARCTRQSVLNAGRNVKFLSSLQETSRSFARNAIGREGNSSSSSDHA